MALKCHLSAPFRGLWVPKRASIRGSKRRVDSGAAWLLRTEGEDLATAGGEVAGASHLGAELSHTFSEL